MCVITFIVILPYLSSQRHMKNNMIQSNEKKTEKSNNSLSLKNKLSPSNKLVFSHFHNINDQHSSKTLSLEDVTNLTKTTNKRILRIHADIRTKTDKFVRLQPSEEKTALKAEISKLKRQLPIFKSHGTCDDINNTNFKHNGIVQIDIDNKYLNGDVDALNQKKQLTQVKGICYAAISPSGYGVKALLRVSNDITKNGASVEVQRKMFKVLILAARAYIINELNAQINIDKLSLEQVCYYPSDCTVFSNQECSPIVLNTSKILVK